MIDFVWSVEWVSKQRQLTLDSSCGDNAMIEQLMQIGWSEDGARFLLDHADDRRIRKFLFGQTEKPRRSSKLIKAYIPQPLRWLVWERDNFTCRNCGSRRYLSIDHIIPESLGGSLIDTNLQTLCSQCNSSKGAQ